MSGNPSQVIAELEALARKNQWARVEAGIRSVDHRSLRASEVIELASMARRAYQLRLAINLLKQFVLDPNGQVDPRAGAKALAEYSVCLTMMGGRKSAERVLRHIPETSLEGLFSWITLHFSTFSYGEAIPYLEKYIHLNPDPYKQKVGELNLCASHVAMGEYEIAQSLLNQLKSYFQLNNHKLLLANSLELQGQIYVFQRQWSRALDCLERAKELMQDDNKLYALFVKKWHTICHIYFNKTSLSELHSLLLEAKGLGHFQSVRDLIFYWSLFTKNEKQLQKVYYGTPFASYRRFVSSQSNSQFQDIEIPWNGDFFEHQWRQEFRIEKCPRPDLSLSQSEITLLEVLSKDFFEPQSVGSLFDKLFPDEHLDPDYSIPKTYKIIQRLNKKLSESTVEISIKNTNQKYQLGFADGWMIPKVHPEYCDHGFNTSEVRLIGAFARQPFSREDIMSVFSLKRTTALRWIKELRDKGLLTQVGSGPGAFYRIAV